MSKKLCTFAADFESEKCFSGNRCPGGGMVDTVDSKSAARKGVRVQVPPGVQNGGRKTAFLFAINRTF